MNFKYLFFFIFLATKSAELADVGIREERGLSLALAAGPLWRNLKDLEKFNLIEDPTITQKYDFIINKAQGFQIEAEAKYKFNRYISLILAADYSNAKKGYGYFEIYNINQNNEKISVEELEHFRPQIKEKQVDVGNETTIFKKEFMQKEVECLLYIGYTRNSSLFEAIWETDRSFSKALWRGFSAGLQFFFNLTENLEFGVGNFINPDRLTVTNSRDSFAGQDPAIQDLHYLGYSLELSISHAICNGWSIISLFEWTYFTKIRDTIKFQVAENDKDKLINPKICTLKENVYLFTFGLEKEF